MREGTEFFDPDVGDLLALVAGNFGFETGEWSQIGVEDAILTFDWLGVSDQTNDFDTMMDRREGIEQFLDSQITTIDDNLIPHSEASGNRDDVTHLDVVILGGGLGRSIGFKESECRCAKIDVGTAELVNVKSLLELDELDGVQSSDHGSGGGDGGDDVTSNHLGAVTIS